MEQLRNFYSVFYDSADPRTRDWLFMGNPKTVLTVTGLWLAFVLEVGPRMMRHRSPMKLKGTITAVNGLQVIANLYALYEYLSAGWLTTYKFQCEPCDFSNHPNALRMARATYIYLLLKLFDMVDTVIYVLRCKENQITFLHLYHHLSTLLLAWVVTNYAPGGHGTFVQLLNTIVHVAMYTYYFISGLGPQYRRFLWWKRYLTRMQLVQFVLQFAHNVNALRIDCDYPRFIIYLFLPIITLMFVLFLRFYAKTYTANKKNKKQ